MVIDGKKIASDIIERLKRQGAPKGFLAAFIAGDDSESICFLKQKENVANELGVDFRLYKFPKKVSGEEFRKEISKSAADKDCRGIIVQLPLPSGINRNDILAAVPPEKDVDALRGNLVLSPAAGVVEEILKTENFELKNKKAVVVGLGFLVGKPVSDWLKEKCAELYCLDIGSDLSVLKQADLVILGTGQTGLIKPETLKDNVLVIDFGYGTKDGKVSGDFNSMNIPDSIRYTPTPGGTGPVLVAKLFENFLKLSSI